MPTLPTPSWTLVVWCGLAAALASEWIVAALRAALRRPKGLPRAAAPRSAVPRLMTAPVSNLPLAIASGTVLFAPAYGLLFEWWQRADLAAGITLGLAHGSIVGLIVLGSALKHRNPPGHGPSLRAMALFRARRLLTRVLYGAVLGFLYVVPAA